MGDSVVIRSYAAKFSSFPQPIAQIVPSLILWTIRCCSQERSFLTLREYGGNEGTRRQMIDRLKLIAKDMMMYSGFLRYRLPASVNDTLAKIAAE
jgi:nuclear pore complex protein Nup93